MIDRFSSTTASRRLAWLVPLIRTTFHGFRRGRAGGSLACVHISEQCLPLELPMLLTAAEYRESLREYAPRVYLDGELVGNIPDAPAFAPGINAIGVAYELAHDPAHRAVMT